MITSTAWHIVKDKKRLGFVKSFKLVADVQQMFTSILVETFKMDKDMVPTTNTEEKEYWVREVEWPRDGDPTIHIVEIDEKFNEKVP